MPHEMGNMIILFGVLLSLGIFFSFGITQNMWGGFEFQPEGSIFSLVILFFAKNRITNENIDPSG